MNSPQFAGWVSVTSVGALPACASAAVITCRSTWPINASAPYGAPSKTYGVLSPRRRLNSRPGCRIAGQAALGGLAGDELAVGDRHHRWHGDRVLGQLDRLTALIAVDGGSRPGRAEVNSKSHVQNPSYSAWRRTYGAAQRAASGGFPVRPPIPAPDTPDIAPLSRAASSARERICSFG